jgi:hypothetical protein
VNEESKGESEEGSEGESESEQDGESERTGEKDLGSDDATQDELGVPTMSRSARAGRRGAESTSALVRLLFVKQLKGTGNYRDERARVAMASQIVMKILKNRG